MQNLKTKNKLYLNFIYLFFLIALSISSSASPIIDKDDASNKQTCHHDLSTKNYDIQPIKKEGFEHYPKYLADFAIVSARLVGKKGDFGYYLEGLDSDLNYECCNLDNHQANTNKLNYVKDRLKTIPKKYRERHCILADDLHILIWENPKYKKNWTKAMKFLEQHLLSKKVATKKRKSKKKSNTNIFSVSTQSITQLLKLSHWKLANGLKTNEQYKINQGQYRTQEFALHEQGTFRDLTIFEKKMGTPAPKLDHLDILQLRDTDAHEIAILSDFYQRMALQKSAYKTLRAGAIASILQKFSTEEQKIINKYITIAPEAPKIEELMGNFAEEFKIKGKFVDEEKLHPIIFAAWIHTEIIRIAPFLECNGKLARLWMNTFLLRYGYLAPILTNEEDYLDAVKKELNGETNAFADYIAQQIELTTKYFSDPNGNPELELSLGKL